LVIIVRVILDVLDGRTDENLSTSYRYEYIECLSH
jgi:hypothetical protein